MSRGANACRSSSRSIGMRTGSSAITRRSDHHKGHKGHQGPEYKPFSQNLRNVQRETYLRAQRVLRELVCFLCVLGVLCGSKAVSWRLVFRSHDRLDPAARGKIPDDRHATRVNGRDQIVEDLVRHVFVEDPAVAELDDVVLQRLQLD